MARAPGSRVSKSSGQGVSRLAYMRTYNATHKRGAQAAPKVNADFEGSSSPRRDHGKVSRVDYPGGINVSYGDTIEPGTLEDIQQMYTKHSK